MSVALARFNQCLVYQEGSRNSEHMRRNRLCLRWAYIASLQSAMQGVNAGAPCFNIAKYDDFHE